MCTPGVVRVTVQWAVPVSAVTATAAQTGMVMAPSLKATVPASGDGLTVAVKVTEAPATEGFCDELEPRPSARRRQLHFG